MKNVRFGVVGCGGISKIHVDGILGSEGAEFVAAQDVIADNAAKYAEAYKVKAYADYETMLQQDDIDVICICTPSGQHAQQTILAAQAGKHVIVEKPMAIELADVDRMIQACEDHGVWLATILPRRVSPAVQFAKKMIDTGRLGKLSLCTAHGKYYRDQAYYDRAGWRGTWAMDGGGAFMNQGIHTIDLLQYLAGPVKSLHGQAAAILRNIEVEDTGVAMLKFENGALGVIEITTTSYKQPDHRVVIQGEKGTLIITGDEITSFDLVDEEVNLPEFAPFSVIPDGHRIQIQDMVHAVREGRQPLISGIEGKHALQIILGTYEASRENKEVMLSSL